MDSNSAIRDTLIRDTRRGVGNRAQTPRCILYSIPHTFSGVRGSISNQHYVSQPKNPTATRKRTGYRAMYKTDTHSDIIFCF